MSYRAWSSGLGLVALCALGFLLSPSGVHAQGTAIAPYFLVVVDNSGSMTASTGGGTNSCGQAQTRINDARCVLQHVVSAYGEVQFGLMRYNETVTGTCPAPTATGLNCNGCANSGAGCPAAGALASQGQLLVPIGPRAASSVFSWSDFTCTGGWDTGTNPELRPDTWTPIAGTVRGARDYFQGGTTYTLVSGATRPAAPITSSATDRCRPVALIFLTDGEETCASDAATTAAIDELWASTIGGMPRNIPSYWIGFGIAPGDAYIESFATHGHTDAPGAFRGFYATDETSLALAFSQIISNSILTEVCDGADNDCDTRIDEGYTLYCNRPTHPAQDLCTNAGEVCDGIDNNCNGTVDEGVRNACGGCGAVPAEVCDGIDNNCNGTIDEGVCGGCMPSTEVCDGIDNNCDGTIDNITRPCGSSVGTCTVGTQLCTAGTWGTCSGTNPTPEVCDGLDNDCDGVVDGQTQACGSAVGACRPGLQVCTAGMFGPCIGAVGPGTEVCNGLDDNCNGTTDEGDPGGGAMCGSTVGVCRPGTYHCVAGAITCSGGASGTPEVCNGLDDDCNGLVDDGIAPMGTCGMSGVGACHLGQMLCVMGSFQCVGAIDPSPEVCDGLDNNCNGMVDEGNPGGGAVCGSNVGACRQGTSQCVMGTLSCVGAVGPTMEVCNMIDDDCNGVVDDGIPIGAACGSSVGECTPGTYTCDPATGMLVCTGAHMGTTESCNLLDDDCDGVIDEDVGGGTACGSMVGACRPGTQACVAGAIVCSGEVGPAPETCDCNDNDCDGTVDNPPAGGALCGSGADCVMCQCASRCQMSEFGLRCPDGTTLYMHDGVCNCVTPACDAATCATETHSDAMGTVLCQPGSDTIGACVCRNNACTFGCEGVTCSGGLVCADRGPHLGTCVVDNCNGLGCPAGQVCNATSGACETDPCATVTCPSDQACRAGHCEMTCAGVTCTTGQICHAGTCTNDNCARVSCPSGRVCDPSTNPGTCVMNMCSGVSCSMGTSCDPVTGMCVGDPCLGLRCPAMTECRAGECQATMPATHDAGPMADAGVGMDSGPGVDSGLQRVLAAGGGGCLCNVGESGRTSNGATLVLLALGGVLVARRRRAARGGAR